MLQYAAEAMGRRSPNLALMIFMPMPSQTSWPAWKIAAARVFRACEAMAPAGNRFLMSGTEPLLSGPTSEIGGSGVPIRKTALISARAQCVFDANPTVRLLTCTSVQVMLESLRDEEFQRHRCRGTAVFAR
jgi:hypothetical protein